MAEHAHKVGDRVAWQSHGGEAHGTVVRVVTDDGSIGDFDYKASRDEPRIIVETAEGKRAAHRAEALTKA